MRSIVRGIVLAAIFLIFLVGTANAGCVGEDTGTDYGCGDIVTESCTFNENQSCLSGHGLIIGADNITIDGNGYILDSVNSACMWENVRCGILNEGYDNVAIKSIEVKKFCFGIRLRGTSNHIENNTIENSKIHHNGNATSLVATHGIKMEYVYNSTIRNNRIHDQIAHVDPNPSCEDGGNGLFLYKGDYNHITQNKVYNNIKGGIFMKACPMYNSISYNELWGNGQGGIIFRCKLTDNNLVEHNTISDNYGSGIFIGGNNNTIKYNTVCNNKDGGPYYEDWVGGHGYGIFIGRSDGSCFNTLISNKVCGNDYLDIYVVQCSEVIGNTGDENTCDTTYNYGDKGTTGCTYGCYDKPGCVAEDSTVYRCGDTVMKSCSLNGSMTCPAGQHGLIIGTDGITIDGNGYAIIGSGCGDTYIVGVYNYNEALNCGYNNVIIKNLEVKNFCTGIRVAGNLYELGGKCLVNTTNNTIDNCVVYDNGNSGYSGDYSTGIDFWPCVTYSTITRCEVYNTTGGVATPPCESGGIGIRLKAACNHNNITCNYVHDNRHCGIFTKAKCMYNYAAYNNITGNGVIASDASTGGIILRCKCSDNWVIEKNNVTANYGPGIFIGGNFNTVKCNTILHNKNKTSGDIKVGYGINIGRGDGGDYNGLYSNVACENEGVDIHTCGVGGGCVETTGDENTCDSTVSYDDKGTTGCTYSCEDEKPVFDTEEGTYPSIFGIHKGKIIPDEDIIVNKMYTYPCKGTGGHTEYVRIWNESEGIEGEGNWSGYQDDYHNITISPTITLLKNHEYNYTIRTGSYPQIIHAREYKAEKGGNITCEEFIDANEKVYSNWIPAIRLCEE